MRTAKMHASNLQDIIDIAKFGTGMAVTESRECAYCGTSVGLRQVHDGGGFIAPEYACEDCFTGQDDGPCFDDLPAA